MKSDLEELLAWYMHVAGMPVPEREYKFHPTRRWRFDFAYPDKMIAIEVEGGTWVNGAHNRGGHYQSDCEKYNAAVLLGWKVLRFTRAMVEGNAIKTIQDLMQ